MSNIRVKAIDVYHGDKVVPNEVYLEHFRKLGKDIEHLMVNIFGRDKRYMLSDSSENTLTMAIKAATGVLKKANLKGTDIDLIVFSSILTEYTAPPCSIFIHEAIQGKRETICYDMNGNCAGMTIAVEQVSKYMQMNPDVKNALIVGSDYISMLVHPENELTYGNFGDASCALLLEKTDEDAGVIDAKYYISSEECRNITFPACGFSNIFNVNNKEDMLFNWLPFDGSACTGPAIENIQQLLLKHNLTNADVNLYCLSQFAYKNIELIQEGLCVDKSKFIYIGDEYGYTGTTSPWIALFEGIERGLVKRGDYLIFWTIGAGSQSIALLYKY
jgi:3-oxoacyl-[acyl-carrier-protein] synthase III